MMPRTRERAVRALENLSVVFIPVAGSGEDTGDDAGERAAEQETVAGAAEWSWTPIGETSTDDYINGSAALGLRAENLGAGGCWWREYRSATGAALESSARSPWADGVRVAKRVLSTEGLADLRPGLRNAGHPDGNRDHPVIGATHVRATLEIAWQLAKDETSGARRERVADRLNARTLRRWLGEEERSEVVHKGTQMTAYCNNERWREVWEEWLELVQGSIGDRR